MHRIDNGHIEMKTMLILMILAGPSLTNAASYYVASTGDDVNPGTLVKPFHTIQKAADVMQSGDICWVRAGVYRETVVPAHSGRANAPIVFEPYKNESVTVNGTEVVRGWQLDAGKIYQAPMSRDFFVSAHNQTGQVFVDGRMVNLARWPNTSADISHPAKATLSRDSVSKSRSNEWTTVIFEDDDLEPKTDGYYVGSEICIQPNKDAWSWELSGEVIAQHGNRLTIRSRNNCGKDGNDKIYPAGSRYFIFNSRKLLDSPGEWYHDGQSGNLYLEMPDADNPAAHVVEAKKREFAFNLENRSYITVRGFTLFACTITTDTAAGGDGVPYNADGTARYPWRGRESGVASANHIVIEGINAKYLSHFTDVSGHFFLQWGQGSGIILSGSDCVLQNCRLQYSAGNGVTLLGQRNKVLNNFLYDMDYSAVDCSAINTGGVAVSVDHEIGFNTIARTGRSGITPRGLQNSNPTNFVARIHHNDISDCMLQDCDGGGIYTASKDFKFVRIDHNWIHDISGFTASGIYPDFTKNIIVDHNIIWNVEWGIHLQGHVENQNNALCYQNTILVTNTSGTAYGPFGVGNNVGINNGTVIRNNIICCQNPATAPGYKVVSEGFGGAEITNNLACDAVVGSGLTPKFVDYTRGDFRLAKNSPAHGAARLVSIYVRDGVSVPAFLDAGNASHDLGAYETTLNPWRAGATISNRD
jgi:hypothetical protein